MEEVKEVSAKTVDEAIELALRELGASRDEVEIEVISRGKSGFLGFGGEPARVRVRRLPPTGQPAQRALQTVNRLLSLLRVSATAMLRSAQDPSTGGPVIDIHGDDAGLLIGHRGETLRAFQFLITLMVNARQQEQVRVVIDVADYRAKRQRVLRNLALRVAQRVAASGRSVTLEPMPPDERRIIHLALANHPRVTTYSTGQGSERRVTVAPRNTAPSDRRED